jgi:hypothetical protein
MATVVAAVQGPGNSQKNQCLSAIGLLAAAVLYTNALHGNNENLDHEPGQPQPERQRKANGAFGEPT